MALLSGRRGHARVVLLPIIDAELQAVQAVFGATAEIGYTGVYTLPEYAASEAAKDPLKRRYPFVVARSADRSNTPANSSTREMLEWYQPEVVLVVGIGGGIQRGVGPSKASGPELGDVVIGRYVHYAEYTKNLPSGSRLRYIALDQPSSWLVSRHADPLAVAPGATCFSRLSLPRPDETTDFPAIHVSEVVVAESIAGNPSAEKQMEMIERFDNADVVDMESMGVGRALHDYRIDPHYNPLWLPVRGVSDIVTAAGRRSPGEKQASHRAGQQVADGSSTGDNEGPDHNDEQRKQWKKYASHAAACVARTLVERLLSEERPESPCDPGAPRWEPGPANPDTVGG
jgi:nucleoside phosphorylase